MDASAISVRSVSALRSSASVCSSSFSISLLPSRRTWGSLLNGAETNAKLVFQKKGIEKSQIEVRQGRGVSAFQKTVVSWYRPLATLSP
jgi:hypothetical protein